MIDYTENKISMPSDPPGMLVAGLPRKPRDPFRKAAIVVDEFTLQLAGAGMQNN